MLTLQKIAYGVGISIAVSVFVLFLYSFLPHLINNDQWENVDGLKMSNEELLKEFQATPAYVAFYERYPDAREELNNQRHGGDMQVGIANLEKGNFLKLHLYFNKYDDRVNVNVSCETSNNSQNMHADGLFAVDFIKQTNCLNLESSLSEPTHTVTELPNGTVRID
jgi:hypothetical protein